MRVSWVLVLFAILGIVLPALTYGATEITYWDQIRPGDGSPRGTALAKILERFQAKNPDIRIKVEVMGAPLIISNLVQGASVGNSPDVSQLNGRELEMVVGAEAIQPLDGFAKSVDKADWLFPWNNIGTFINGHKYAMPWGYRYSVLMYRKDILDKGRVQVPTTWDELCTVAGKINSPQVMGYGFGLSPEDNAGNLVELAEDVIYNAGSQLFDDRARAIFNNTAGLKFFQLIADLVGKCRASGPQVVELRANTVDEGLQAGTISMMTEGTHRFTTMQAMGAGDNLRWAPNPSFEKGKPAPVTVSGWVVAMGKHAKHPAEAWKLIEFLTSAEAQVVLGQVVEIPSRKSTYTDPWFKTPEAKRMVDWSEYLRKNGRFGRHPVTWPEFTQILSAETQSVVAKGVSPALALRNTVERYNQVVDQRK